MRWLLLLAGVASAHAQTHVKIAGRDVALWKPSGQAPQQGFPVIVFSHGFTGSNTQSTFLMDAFARAGYLVAAPNHQDAFFGAKGRSFPRAQEPFAKDHQWSEATYKDRRADIEALLDAITAEKTFEGVRVDAGRIALAGHSLGGYTVLGLGGGWPSWKDARVKAVLALSPFCTPFIQNGGLARMNVPVMYQGGTLDVGITPSVRRGGGAYERSSSPKYYVELKGAGHFAWTDLNPRFQEVIARYSVAFMDQHLKGADALPALFKAPYPRLVTEARQSVKTTSATDSRQR